MGELVVGKPALRLSYVVSLPIDLVSVMSLLYRAVSRSGLDPWLVETRKQLPGELVAELDLLHGFSGNMLYYMEEPVMRFDPLRSDRIDATFEELIAFFESLEPADYLDMVVHALERVHHDQQIDGMLRPSGNDVEAWRTFIAPGQTSADLDEVLSLIFDPESLKRRTIALIEGIWENGYRDEFEFRRDQLAVAAQYASRLSDRGAAQSFTELTGSRVPSHIASRLPEAEQVAFCPSAHVGSFISYIYFAPVLVIFFSGPKYLERNAIPDPVSAPAIASAIPVLDAIVPGLQMGQEPLLDALRALGDQNRLHILQLLAEGELYAQEIVGRLGIAQSAVSRHLSLLERAGLVKVRPRGGMKYYAIDSARLDTVAGSLRCMGQPPV